MTNAVTKADTAVTPAQFNEALIKAVGWDRVPAEQRALALHICEQYGLDPMLRHVVMIEGKPYITRDGLLHVAHRSGVFDGIEVTDPALVDTHWHARASVYRKDMSRPFVYPGRYPKGKGNYPQEMAIKVAEVMSLRRAFDVSAPVMEERWDLDDAAAPEKREPMPLAAKVAARREAIEARPIESNQCESMSPSEHPTRCGKEAGHAGNHANRDRETWPQEASDVGHPGASGDNVETPTQQELDGIGDLTAIADAVFEGDVLTAMPIEVSAALGARCGDQFGQSEVTCDLAAGHKAKHRDDSGLVSW